MKRVVLIAAVLVGLASGLYAANETYTLRRVYNGADAVQCGKDGGKASMVADLDSDGVPTTEFLPFCLIPVK